jgi:hypothetical protein
MKLDSSNNSVSMNAERIFSHIHTSGLDNIKKEELLEEILNSVSGGQRSYFDSASVALNM